MTKLKALKQIQVPFKNLYGKPSMHVFTFYANDVAHIEEYQDGHLIRDTKEAWDYVEAVYNHMYGEV